MVKTTLVLCKTANISQRIELFSLVITFCDLLELYGIIDVYHNRMQWFPIAIWTLQGTHYSEKNIKSNFIQVDAFANMVVISHRGRWGYGSQEYIL